MSKARSTGNIGNIIKTSATCVTVNDGTTDLLIMSGSGTVTIPGNLVVLGGIAGSSAESSSYSLSSSFATNANTLDGIDGASFLQTGSFNTFSSSIDTTIKNKLNGDGVISGSVQVDITNTTGYSTFSSSLSSSIGSLSGSVATTTSGLAGRITIVEGNYVTTGSNTFIGNQTITGSICTNGNIVTTGQIVAQTINVQQVTSSIVYSCGSNIFGCSITDIQQITGSLRVTGSNALFNVNCIGIGTTTPFRKLTVDTSDVASDGVVVRGNSSPAYTICETSGVGSTFTNDSAAGYIGTITNHPFNVRSNSQNRLTFSNAGVACFACQVCTPTLVAGTGGIKSSNNIIFPSNLTTFTIWNEGYGGAVQLRRSDATTDRYARIGIVDNSGNWVVGMTINGSNGDAEFGSGICGASYVCAAGGAVFASTNVRVSTGTVAGNSSDPAITTGGCTKTGIYFDGSCVALGSGGNSLLLAQNGNVGIGTTSPNYKLEVSGNACFTGGMAIGGSYCAFALNVHGVTYQIGGSTWVQNGYGYVNAGATTTGLFPMSDSTIQLRVGNTSSLMINSSGISCFINTVCAPGIYVGTTSNNTILSSSRIHLNTCVQRLYTINHWELSNGSGNQCTVVDGAATYGCAKVANINASSTYFFGPYSYLTPGSYVAKFRMKVDNNSSNATLFYLDTNRGAGVNISANTFCTSGCYQYINLPFTISSPSDVFEARGLSLNSGITCVYLDHVLVEAAENPGQYFSKDNFRLYTGHFNTPRLNIDTNGNTIFNCNGTYCSNYAYNFLGSCNGSMLSGAHVMGNMGAGTQCATPYWCNTGALRMEFNWATNGYINWTNHNNCTPMLLQWSADNQATKHCFDYVGNACHCGIVIAKGYQGMGFSTLSAGSGTGIASFDTITRSGVGLYEVSIIANPNAGGSDYYDFWYGRLIIGRGYSGSEVRDYLVWCQESTQPRSLYSSGGGNLAVTACMYYGGSEYSSISRDGSYTVRFKISGYNSSYTGAGTTLFLKLVI